MYKRPLGRQRNLTINLGMKDAAIDINKANRPHKLTNLATRPKGLNILPRMAHTNTIFGGGGGRLKTLPGPGSLSLWGNCNQQPSPIIFRISRTITFNFALGDGHWPQFPGMYIKIEF